MSQKLHLSLESRPDHEYNQDCNLTRAGRNWVRLARHRRNTSLGSDGSDHRLGTCAYNPYSIYSCSIRPANPGRHYFKWPVVSRLWPAGGVASYSATAAQVQTASSLGSTQDGPQQLVNARKPAQQGCVND